MMEKRRGEEAAKMEHKKEEKRRRVAAYREEREKKLERRQRWRRIPMPRGRKSGLVALSSLHDLLVLWFILQCYLVLDFALCCHVMYFKYGRT